MLVVGIEPRALWSQERCQPASLGEAQAMAIKAAELLLAKGPRNGFLILNGRNGEFVDKDLYVFIFDLNGRIWFNAFFPVAPGRSIIGSRDRNGRCFIQEMIEVAQNEGEGWVDYDWFSPRKGEMESKSTCVVRVGPLVVGVGAYGIVGL